MKRCSKCGVEKPLEAFSRDASKSNGSSSCKPCAIATSAAWRQARPGAAARAAARQASEDLAQQGRRRCSKCGEDKTLDNFYVRGTRKGVRDGRLRSWCKICTRPTGEALDRQRARKYHTRPAHKARQRELATGFNAALFARVLERQKGLCAICGKKMLGPGRTQARSGSKACADHDHTTRTPRGILCGRCNSALGLFDDSPERLITAAYYLINPPVERA